MKSALTLRALVLAGSLFSCVAWSQTGAAFSVMAPASVVQETQAAATANSSTQQRMSPMAVQAQHGSPQAATGSSLLQKNVNVNSDTQQVGGCDVQASWWYWYMEPLTTQAP